MDLSTISPITREIKILHPKTDQPTGLVIHLLPPSNKKVKAARDLAIQENIQAARRRITQSDADKEASAIKQLAPAVESWEWTGDAQFRGEKPAFNDANLCAVLKIEWIRNQIDKELGDDAAFFPD